MPLLLFGGLAVGLVWKVARRSPAGPALLNALGAGVAVAVVYLNLHRLHVETPRLLQQTPEAVAAMASERHRCREALAGPLFLADGPEPVFEKLVAASGWTNRVEIRKMPYRLGPRDLALDRCVIAFGAAAIAELQRAAGEAGRADRLVWATDGGGNRRALLLLSAVAEARRAPAVTLPASPTPYTAPVRPPPTPASYPSPATREFSAAEGSR